MYAWQKLDYKEAGNLVQNRDPREFGWGYFGIDNMPQSGIGLFFWFESPTELLDFITNIETQILPDSDTVKKEIQEILKEADLNDGLTNSLRTQINAKLVDIEIKWWGKFSNLRSGYSKFSKEVIGSFFESLSQDNIIKAVPDRYLPQFIEFCRWWGH